MSQILFQYKTGSTTTSGIGDYPNDIIGGFGGGTHVRDDVYSFNSVVQAITTQYFGDNGSIPTNEFDSSGQKNININAVNPFVHPRNTPIDSATKIVIESNNLPDSSVKRINIQSPNNTQSLTLSPGQTLEEFINGYQTQTDYTSNTKNKIKSFDVFYKQNTFSDTEYNFLEDESFTLWSGLQYITDETNLNEQARYVKNRDIPRKEFIFPWAYQIDQDLISMIEYYDTLSYTPIFDNLGRPIVGYGHIITLGETIAGVLITPSIMKVLLDTSTNQHEIILITHEEAESLLIDELTMLSAQLVPYLGNKLILPGMMRALISLVRNIGFDNFMKTIEGRRILAAVRFNYMEYFIDNLAAFNNPYGGQSFITNSNNTTISSQLTYSDNAVKPNAAAANLTFIPFSLYEAANLSVVPSTSSLPSNFTDPTPMSAQTNTMVSPTIYNSSAITSPNAAPSVINPSPINPYTDAQAAKTIGPNPNAYDNKPVDPKAYKCFLPSPQDNLGLRRTDEAAAASTAPDGSTQTPSTSTIQSQQNAQSGVDTSQITSNNNPLNSDPTAQAAAQQTANTLALGTPAPAAAAAAAVGATVPVWTTAGIAGVMGVAQGENGMVGSRAGFPGGASDISSAGWDGSLFGGDNNTMMGNFQFNKDNQSQLYKFTNSDYNTTGSNDAANPAVQTQFVMTQVTPGNPYSDSIAINGLKQTGFWTTTDPVQASYAWNYAYERNNSVSYYPSSGQFYTNSYSAKTATFAQQYYSLMGGS